MRPWRYRRALNAAAPSNVWRNASATPVRSKPLAVCDVRSVPQEALGTYFLVEGGDKSPRRMGQNLKLHYSPGHAWWYYPQMTKDEALVFYTYDGREPESPRFTLHSAFDEEGIARRRTSTLSVHCAFGGDLVIRRVGPGFERDVQTEMMVSIACPLL